MDPAARRLKLGSAGMRGIVGNGLTPKEIINYSAAIGTFLNGGDVLVGCDNRFASPMIKEGAIAALAGCGCKVIDGDVLPAPLMHFLIPHLKLSGGILIGGGHQNQGWNSLIPLSADGAYFNSIRQRELLDIYHSRSYHTAQWDEIKPITKLDKSYIKDYFDHLCEVLDVEAIAQRNFTVVADFCNGSGAMFYQEFAKRLNINLIAVNDQSQGSLPRDPEPRPRAASSIRSLIKPLNAACGLVFNSDMSRMEIVSDGGEPLSEELTVPLLANYWLGSNSELKKVVTNICSSQSLDAVVKKHNASLEKTKVGQAAVVDCFKESCAYICGEGSGGCTNSFWLNGFDAFFMAGSLLEAIARTNKTVSQMVNGIPRYYIVKKNLECLSSHGYSLIRSLRGKIKCEAIVETDGLRFEWYDGYVSVRMSVTDQVIRLISESKNKETAQSRLLEIISYLEY